jgi:hypothetical protein
VRPLLPPLFGTIEMVTILFVLMVVVELAELREEEPFGEF